MVTSMNEPREMSDTELARRIFFMVAEAEHQLGIPYDWGKPLFERCKRVLMFAQNGSLSPETYRFIWRIADLVRSRHG